MKKIKDINFSEGFYLITLSLMVLFFGFYPEPILETIKVSVDNLISNYNFDVGRKITLK